MVRKFAGTFLLLEISSLILTLCWSLVWVHETVATGGKGTYPDICLDGEMTHAHEPQHHEIMTRGDIEWVMMDTLAS